MLTMNCLNGYFVAPAFDSLAEARAVVFGSDADDPTESEDGC